jgi:hypothetical protein
VQRPATGRALGVVVLGMPRSGTSSVSRMFVQAGFYAGAEAGLMPANEFNPTGFWEQLSVWQANERVLGELAANMLDPPSASAQRRVRDWARPLLAAELERTLAEAGALPAPALLKDPRIGVLMALWWPLLRRKLHPVLVVRDPIESARSIERTSRTPPQLALACWELHMTTLLGSLAGSLVTVAPYATLLGEARQRRRVVEAASAQLTAQLAASVDPGRAESAIDPRLRHQRVRPDEHEQYLTGSQKSLWRLLSSLEPGTQRLEVERSLRKPTTASRDGARRETERAQLENALAAARDEVARAQAQLAEATSRRAPWLRNRLRQPRLRSPR